MSFSDDLDDLLYDPEVEQAEQESLQNPRPAQKRKKGTLDWTTGSKVFSTFAEFDTWRKCENIFNWIQAGHSKTKICLEGVESYEWYKYTCKSHEGCKASVS